MSFWAPSLSTKEFESQTVVLFHICSVNLFNKYIWYLEIIMCHTFLIHMNWSIISGRLGYFWWTDVVLGANYLHNLRMVWLLPWLPPRCSLQVPIRTNAKRNNIFFTGLPSTRIKKNTTGMASSTMTPYTPLKELMNTVKTAGAIAISRLSGRAWRVGIAW